MYKIFLHEDSIFYHNKDHISDSISLYFPYRLIMKKIELTFAEML